MAEQQTVPANEQRASAGGSFHHLSYEEVDALDTGDIIDRLRALGVPFDKDTFLKDVETFYSAEEVSENWFKQYNLVIDGRMEDFPWFAAWVLWTRMAPQENLAMEQMVGLLNRGIAHMKEGNVVSGCDRWLEMWEAIKYRIDPTFRTLDYLDAHYRGGFFIGNFVQDLEFELYNAAKRDPSYFEKRIAFCREFCKSFPDEDELIIHNMRRAIADSYGGLGQYDKAEAEFQQLVHDFPDNHWGYTGWADLLFMDKKQDFDRAKELYEKALLIAKASDDGEEIAVRERLADVNQAL